jgi:hypothetical protein
MIPAVLLEGAAFHDRIYETGEDSARFFVA